MQAIIIDKNKEIYENISHFLLLKNISPRFYNIKSNIIEKVSNDIDDSSAPVLFFIYQDENIFSYIESIKKMFHNVKIVPFSKSIDKKIVNKLITFGISNFLKYNNLKDFSKKLKEITPKLEIVKNEKRKFTRYNVEDFGLKTSFIHPLTLKKTIGKVNDISLGGAYITFFKEIPLTIKLEKRIIENFKIYFSSETPFVAKIKVMKIRENSFGIKFIEIEKQDFMKLINFIKNFVLYDN